MKTLHTLLFLVFVSVGFAANGFTVPTAAAPVSDEVLLSAIAAVETGNNPARLGYHGERTQLQIMPQTWRRYSRLPHSQAATHPAETDRVARAYLAAIRARLKERGLPETPFFIAAAWNAGPGWRRLGSSTVSYAERVANLVAMAPAEPARQPQPAKAVVAVAPTPPTTVAAPVAKAPIAAPSRIVIAPMIPAELVAKAPAEIAVLASFPKPAQVIDLDQAAPTSAVLPATNPPIALMQIGFSN